MMHNATALGLVIWSSDHSFLVSCPLQFLSGLVSCAKVRKKPHTTHLTCLIIPARSQILLGVSVGFGHGKTLNKSLSITHFTLSQGKAKPHPTQTQPDQIGCLMLFPSSLFRPLLYKFNPKMRQHHLHSQALAG